MTSERIQRLAHTLHHHGYRLTQARQAILSALVQSGAHVSADGLVELVRQQTPHVGRMTVYRTLDLLCQLGLARPVYHGTGAAHYILMEDGHHHHLVCSNCDSVVEFNECVLHELETQIGRHHNFHIHGHLVELYGLCANCQRA